MTITEMLLFVAGLFGGTLLFLEMGRRVGLRQLARKPAGQELGLGAFEGAIFGLMGLLMAFTFSGAASRFDMKRQLIVDEANAIGTAYLRIDLLPAAAQPSVRENFRKYVDARLAFYRKLQDADAAKEEMDRATALQGEIWSQAVAASRDAGSPAVVTLVLSSLNAMIDITTTRAVAHQTHPPGIIFALLMAMALICSLLAGYGTAGKTLSWIHTIGFAASLAITVYVVLDLEYPRVGLLRLDAVDQVLVQVRSSMK
jgi:hypothetical protein